MSNNNNWNWKALACTTALLWGLYLFLAGLFAAGNVSFWWFNPQIFNLLTVAYPGFSASFVGAIVGLLWGLVCGGICGGIFAWLYNWLNSKV